ncbi:MAG: hypothetical protein RMM53_09175 [Bacteroidia bacterium]|nr:hypothetical protein [Bacteroidia bacterium]MDW8334372.1 hypothetical protein [Bacteroidia bacterium]
MRAVIFRGAVLISAVFLTAASGVPTWRWSRVFVADGTAARFVASAPVNGRVSFRNARGAVVYESRLNNIRSKDFLLPPDKYLVVLETPGRVWETELDLRISGPTDDWRLFSPDGKPMSTAETSARRIEYRLNHRAVAAATRGYRVFLYRRLRPDPGDEAVHFQFVYSEKKRFVRFPAGIAEISGTVDLEGLPSGWYRLEIYFYDGESVVFGGGTNFRLVGSDGLSDCPKETLALVAPGDKFSAADLRAAAGESAEEFFEHCDPVRWQYGPPDSLGPEGQAHYFKYRTIFPKPDGQRFAAPPRLVTAL